jgi:photosynthetic reaction center cytochrome c subunit
MKVGSRRMILGAVGTAVVCLLGIVMAGGQAGAAQNSSAEAQNTPQKPLMSQDVFKNVQVLRDIPVDEFMGTMGFFTSSLGLSCSDCHVGGGNWLDYAKDTPLKQKAREMVIMMRTINQGFFGGRPGVTCWSCHRGEETPSITPTLVALYGPPPPEDRTEIIVQRGEGPSADQILDKYIQALGGAEQLAKLTSYTGKGTYVGFDTVTPNPLEVFAKAPDQRTTISHDSVLGDTTMTYNGKDGVGWIAAPPSNRPVPLLAITGDELDGAKFDAELAFPSHIKQYLVDWEVGIPATIGDEDVEVLQGRFRAKGLPVKLYFDKNSGLLVRQVRYAHAPVGLMTTQIDYSDYREVNGVKIPFQWKVTWLDGRSTYKLTEVQPNVSINEARFGKPTPPPPVKAAAK